MPKKVAAGRAAADCLGRCGNTWIREENLSQRFADVVRRIEITAEVADWIAEAVRESQDDKERFHRGSVLRLQQQYVAVQAKIDRSYEDCLAGRVSDDLWQRKSKEWELADIRPRHGAAGVRQPRLHGQGLEDSRTRANRAGSIR